MSEYRSGNNYSGSWTWLSSHERAIKIEEAEACWVQENDADGIIGVGFALIGLLCCVAPLSLWFML